MARNDNYDAMLDTNARSRPGRAAKPVLDHIELYPASETGHKDADGKPVHVVEHHFRNEGPEYRKPEKFVFGNEEGAKLVDHLLDHAKIKVKDEKLPRAEKSAEEKANEESEEEGGGKGGEV